MAVFLFILLGIGGAAGSVGALYLFLQSKKGSFGGSIKDLKDILQTRVNLKEEIEGLYQQMGDIVTLQRQGKQLIVIKDSLKTERGRITITHAELETVEARLRELEEIERELEASKTDTQEEMKILEKKKADLAAKNQALKEQISSSMGQLDTAMKELELGAELQGQIENMKLEFVQTQEKIDLLLLQIEQGNEQYFGLKRRYDALDIEYAQLFEKFQAAEEAQKEKV